MKFKAGDKVRFIIPEESTEGWCSTFLQDVKDKKIGTVVGLLKYTDGDYFTVMGEFNEGRTHWNTPEYSLVLVNPMPRNYKGSTEGSNV